MILDLEIIINAEIWFQNVNRRNIQWKTLPEFPLVIIIVQQQQWCNFTHWCCIHYTNYYTTVFRSTIFSFQSLPKWDMSGSTTSLKVVFTPRYAKMIAMSSVKLVFFCCIVRISECGFTRGIFFSHFRETECHSDVTWRRVHNFSVKWLSVSLKSN